MGEKLPPPEINSPVFLSPSRPLWSLCPTRTPPPPQDPRLADSSPVVRGCSQAAEGRRGPRGSATPPTPRPRTPHTPRAAPRAPALWGGPGPPHEPSHLTRGTRTVPLAPGPRLALSPPGPRLRRGPLATPASLSAQAPSPRRPRPRGRQAPS